MQLAKKNGSKNASLTDIRTKSQVAKYCNDLVDNHSPSDRCTNNRVEALLRVSPQLIVNGKNLFGHQHRAKINESILHSVRT